MEKDKKKTLTISSNLKKKIDNKNYKNLRKKIFSSKKKKTFKTKKEIKKLIRRTCFLYQSNVPNNLPL